jgi:hypothetical protein
MWMWLHIRNVVCEQEAKYCSELELNWVCKTDAFNKHINAHIHKVTGKQAVTVALCTRYSGHLQIVWRHQPRTFRKATIQRRPNVALYVRFLPYCSILPSTTRPSKRFFPSFLPPKLVPYLPRVPLFIVLTTLANLQSFISWSFYYTQLSDPLLGPLSPSAPDLNTLSGRSSFASKQGGRQNCKSAYLNLYISDSK